MDAELRDFLRKRKIPEEFIQQLENEKVSLFTYVSIPLSCVIHPK